MKETSMATLILICLLALGVVCIQPIKAQYQGNIIIDDDGGISPSTAPISRAGNVYTLSSNVEGEITIYRSNMVLDGNGSTIAGGLFLNAKSNVTAKNLDITTGAKLLSSDNNFVMGVLVNGVSNTVANNTISGVWSVDAMNAVCFAGLVVEGSGYNLISGNSFVNNLLGMFFSHTSHNLIVGNTITCDTHMYGMSGDGIYFSDASNNTIYHNNFKIEVGGQAADSDSDSVNVWDGGFPFGGNYWGKQTGNEINSTGISDVPYIIDSKNKDRYPLMELFTEAFRTNYEQEVAPPRISILSPTDKKYNESNVPLVFAVDKTATWMGYSLDGKPNVTITGNTTIANMTNGLHSLTVFANDTFGDIGASQTVSFTVAKPAPFPTIAVAAVSGATAVIVVLVGLLVYFKKHEKKN